MIHTNQQEMEFLFEMTRNASVVSGNIDYRRKAKNTNIELALSGTVNAYAQSFDDGNRHKIVMYEGICSAGHLCAFALPDKNPYQLVEVCKYIGKIIERTGQFTPQDVAQGIDDLSLKTDESHLREVDSYSAGFILSIIGHELGHICLSHTLGGRESEGVSRDMERQADSFACSIARSTPFSSYLVPGLLFSEIVLAWATQSYSDEPATTHPHSPERVMNIFNSHEDTLADYGITRNNLSDFLPPTHKINWLKES